MPEARDRLSRQEDVIAAYSRRRIPITGERDSRRVTPITFVLEDENGEGLAAVTPLRWRGTTMVGTPQPMGATARRNAIVPPRIGRFLRFPGHENSPPLVGGGHGRGRGSILPYWYPRRPLNDITAVVRALERRREGQRRGEGLQREGPTPQDQMYHDSPASTSGAQLEHDLSMITPRPTLVNKRCPPSIGKVPKILLDITLQNNEDSECLTPQKKLLNSIDKVEKVVMEELKKLKRTPTAKREEREKRVRTLMSMR